MSRIKDEYDQRERQLKEGYRDGCGAIFVIALIALSLVGLGYLICKLST